MARLGSARLALSGHRFLLRRMDYAVLGRSMPRDRDPLRAQQLALAAGCLVAVGGIVAAAGMAVLRPSAGPGDAPLVMSRQSGALFVRVGETLHPVANLASARLILNSPATARIVDDERLHQSGRGPLLGIPGAPQALGPPFGAAELHWLACDYPDGTTTVAAGPTVAPAALPPQTAVLASAAHGGETVYLLYGDKRAAVDPGDPVTARTLHLDGMTARGVSSTVLNAIPEAPPVTAPRIAGAGEPSVVSGFPVGSVLRVARAGADEYFVVLRDGLQRIGPMTADLIRFGDIHSGPEIVTVAPEAVAGTPLVDSLPVATYPDRTPTLLPATGTVCATWTAGHVTVSVGATPSGLPAPVQLAWADGAGPAVDSVQLPAGYSIDATAATAAADVRARGRYLIADNGVRFTVPDSGAAAALGLGDSSPVGPWSIIGALPAGPELSREAALAAHDVLGQRAPVPSSPQP